MKLINEPKSVDLDESYSKNKSNHSDSADVSKIDSIGVSKRPSIFDDDFQGIEWPVVEKHRPNIHNPLDPEVGVVMSDLPGNIFHDD